MLKIACRFVRKLALLACIGALCALGDPGQAAAQMLQQRLMAEGNVSLGAAARRDGDPVRGAIVFHQSQMACAACHSVGDRRGSLGPDLAKIDKKTTDASLVESVLEPSKVIAPGYVGVTVTTSDGRVAVGLPVEESTERLVLRYGVTPDTLITIKKSEIAERKTMRQSLMPPDQANQLADRQQFLDLICYLIELRNGGPRRAAELAPSPQSIALKLPEYEKHIDHAGMIADLGRPNFQRGEAIYKRVCANCHGTVEQVGSLPTSLRFATGKFKNGSDPYAMYQTLTRGFGMMTPQTWMVPKQKYDVIHYIREAYLKPHNRSQYVGVAREYLARLPRGNTRGPEPVERKPWLTMDYGQSLINTYQVGSDAANNLAYKGIAVRLDPGPGGVTHGNAWMVFDHDTLRVAGAWSGTGFIDFQGIQFDGQHVVHPHVVGQLQLTNPVGPGWGDPNDGKFDDVRLRGRDGKPYGPLPRAWAHYQGLYRNGRQVVIAYSVGKTNVLELPGLAGTAATPVFTRTFNVDPRAHELILQVAHDPDSKARLRDMQGASETLPDQSLSAPIVILGTASAGSTTLKSPTAAQFLVAGIEPPVHEAWWFSDGHGNLRLRLPAGDAPLRFTLWTAEVDRPEKVAAVEAVTIVEPQRDLATLTHGGPPQWPQKLTTQPVNGRGPGPFSVDVLTHPANNPWLAQLRFTGFDFLPGGHEAAICTWDGDVWIVGDLLKPAENLTWQRIASGLFQPLGLKIVRGQIYITCRDQIVVLHDLNGDRETDFFENFNNDHQVTDHFHEFAMGLQTDDKGNFYYTKAARHALPALVPQHGTLLRVSPDGLRTDIVATGFRAANGVCVNPDGTFFLTDQEGHWTPKNRINWVKPGKFYGNMFGYHSITDSSDALMEQPICWITNSFDRSPSEPLVVTGNVWKPLKGALLNFSYGYGRIYVIPYEKVGEQMQGGMCAFNLPDFPTGIMRGRFNPVDGQLYTCGMYAWAGNATEPGGFFRVRYTGGPVYLPIGLSARRQGMTITFTDPLDKQSACDAKNYAVKVWSLKRTAQYGSKHYNEHSLEVKAASLSDDGKTVKLSIPTIAPTWCMEIKYTLQGAGIDGPPVNGAIHNSIYQLRD